MGIGTDAGLGTQAARPAARAAQVVEQRETLLQHVHAALDRVMVLLSITWIALLVAELVTGALPRSLEIALWAIWVCSCSISSSSSRSRP